MRNIIVILFLLIFSLNSVSQNLVRNWSFEDTVSCPTNGNQINKARYWFAPGGGGGSSDLFHSCNNSWPLSPAIVGVPKNIFGFQFANTGSAYAGITPFDISYPSYREYIETRLSQSLNPTINYYVEYWVSLADKSAYAIENMGAFFSTDTMSSTSIIMNSNAQMEHTGGILSDTANWVKVSGYFKPDKDGYQFLTIGNFNTNDSTNYQYLGGTGICYYYIENVVVIDSALQHTIGIDASTPLSIPVLRVFPNPAYGQITVEFDLDINQNIEIQTYNILGEIVLDEKKFCQKSITLDVSGLESGIYFIRVIDENGRVYSEKLIKE